MVRPLLFVSVVLTVSNVCTASLHPPALRSTAASGSESSGLVPSRRQQPQRGQTSLLHFASGLSAVPEAQAEMAGFRGQPLPSSSAAPARGLRASGRRFAGSVGSSTGEASLEAAPSTGVDDNSNGESAVAHYSDGHSRGFVVFILGFVLGAVMCGLLPIVGYAVARAICKRIERGVEASDKASLGVDIDIGKLSVNLYEGYIEIHGFTVFNPPGYSAEYLMKAEAVNVDIRMAMLLCSCFKTVQIDKIVFSGVDVLYDKSWSSSNIDDVINATRVSETEAEKPEASCKGYAACTMREVLFEDVVVRQPMGGANLALTAADLNIQDFTSEFGESRLHAAASEVLRRLLMRAVATQECRPAAASGAAGKR